MPCSESSTISRSSVTASEALGPTLIVAELHLVDSGRKRINDRPNLPPRKTLGRQVDCQRHDVQQLDLPHFRSPVPAVQQSLRIMREDRSIALADGHLERSASIDRLGCSTPNGRLRG